MIFRIPEQEELGLNNHSETYPGYTLVKQNWI